MSSDSEEPRGCEGTAADNDDPAWNFLMPEPDTFVTLKCGGVSFSFRKSILVKDSEYFRTCLENTAFTEAHTSTIAFDDVDPELLGIYLHTVYLRAAGKQIDIKSIVFRGNVTAPQRGLAAMVRLYQMADRFLNHSLLLELSVGIIDFANEIRTGGLIIDEDNSVRWAYDL
ncbi:hypothetical protein QIS74_09711 [Colletotrichum tabaci]|uniref:BTB domain-containing protein n=1 Tax=Colletotrichum tabaci TaxID=1209068 RepID=A0AAV9T529_9PEZI